MARGEHGHDGKQRRSGKSKDHTTALTQTEPGETGHSPADGIANRSEASEPDSQEAASASSPISIPGDDVVNPPLTRGDDVLELPGAEDEPEKHVNDPDDDVASESLEEIDYRKKVLARFESIQSEIDKLRERTFKEIRDPRQRAGVLDSLSTTMKELQDLGEVGVDFSSLVPIRDQVASIEAWLADQSAPDVRPAREKYGELQRKIELLRSQVISLLRSSPKSRTESLKKLSVAQSKLEAAATEGLTLASLVPILDLLSSVEADVEDAEARAAARRFSTVAIAVCVYLLVAVAVLLGLSGAVSVERSAAELNEELFLGIPVPVWVWAVIGSLTSMLLRAGRKPFTDRGDAIRWLIYRPLVGVVMGALIYLLLVAGLIVFAGSADTQAPELVWVVAFVGSFSNTLSESLLQKLMGRLEEDDAAQTTVPDGAGQVQRQEIPLPKPRSTRVKVTDSVESEATTRT